MIQFENFKLRKIISGGQCGADQGGLAAAKVFDLPTGGHAPANYKTVHGNNPNLGLHFGLVPGGTYAQRTELNVKVADGTIRFASNFKTPGEALTLACINKHDKPYFDVQLPCSDPLKVAAKIADFIEFNQIGVLNVAGNSDRDQPTGKHFVQTMGLMLLALDELKRRGLLGAEE